MNAPRLPKDLGLNWSPASLSDAAELSTLFNAVAEADGTPERMSPGSMEHELRSYFDPLEERSLVVRRDNIIVGYATAYSRKAEAEEMRAYVNVYVRPEWRDRGLEDPMTDWAIRAAQNALRDITATHRFVCAWLYRKLEQASARYAERGFTPVRHWWEMECSLAPGTGPQPEAGFSVVAWDTEHDEAARLVHNEAFADHWGSVPMDQDAWRRQNTDNPAFRRSFSFVAIGEEEVVGYASCEEYPEDWEAAGRSEAWIGGLGVLRSWRKRGVASALLAQALAAMVEAGRDYAMIGVDSDSPSGAQHLYENLGFTTRTTAVTWQLAID